MKRLYYLFYIFLLVIILIPKEKLFFTVESYLANHQLFITGESLTNRLLYLDADNGVLVLDNHEIASIGRIRITPLILSNQFSISSISPLPLYRSFFPGNIKTIVFSYSLWHPLSIEMHSEGDFGRCEGVFDLINQKVRIVFEATSELRNYPLIVFKLHKEKEGLVYEGNF